jgi:hypothetical protein
VLQTLKRDQVLISYFQFLLEARFATGVGNTRFATGVGNTRFPTPGRSFPATFF